MREKLPLKLDQPLIDFLYMLSEGENLPELAIAAQLVDLAWHRARAARDPRLRWETLSHRQQEIALLIHAGCTYRQIACQLGLSLETIRTHCRAIYARMGVASKKELRALMRREVIFDEYMEDYKKTASAKATSHTSA